MWERRKHPRFETNILFNLYVVNLKKPPGRACIVDISGGGLCLETQKNFEEGTIFDLRLPWNVENAVPPSPLHGQVVWKRYTAPTYTYGVKFMGLGFRERICLNRYIQALLLKNRIVAKDKKGAKR